MIASCLNVWHPDSNHQRKKMPPHGNTKKRVWTCSTCGKQFRPSHGQVTNRKRKVTATSSCSIQCRYKSAIKTRLKKQRKQIEKISEKISCDVCGKSIKLNNQQFFKWKRGQRRFRCSKECSHDSKYREYRTVKKYCACVDCLEIGETEATRIRFEDFSSKKLGNLARGDVKYIYIKGHTLNNAKYKIIKKVCCYCEKEYEFNTNPVTPTLKQGGWCSQTCKMQQERSQRVVQVIEDIHNFNIEIPPEQKRVRPPNAGKRPKEKYPVWCVSCGHTVMRKPLDLYRRTLPLCKACAPLAQARLCFCGLPRHRTKSHRHENYCIKHKNLTTRLVAFKQRMEQWQHKLS